MQTQSTCISLAYSQGFILPQEPGSSPCPTSLLFAVRVQKARGDPSAMWSRTQTACGTALVMGLLS